MAGLYTESADRNSVVDNAITQRAMEWVRSAVTANPAASTASTGTSGIEKLRNRLLILSFISLNCHIYAVLYCT